MNLPNLFVPGAAKSGTSSLHLLLGQHPQIYMSEVKEPHFFNNSEYFQIDQTPETVSLEKYAQLFSPRRDYKFRGESSTGYMVFPNVIERIQKTISDPRFIFIFRNPIDRAYSHYWWLRGQGYERRPFRGAVLAGKDECPDPQKRVKGFSGYAFYYAFGQYATYLKPYLELFGQPRILIIASEQLRADEKETLKLCFQFLQVSTSVTINPLRANETKVLKRPSIYQSVATLGSRSSLAISLRKHLPDSWFERIAVRRVSLAEYLGGKIRGQQRYPPMKKEERLWLASLYQNEVDNLRRLTGLTFSEWRSDFSE